MEEKELRILMVNNTIEENPSFVYRNKMVGQALNERGHDVFCQSKGIEGMIDIDDYDIFVFNRFYEGSLGNEINALRSLGKIIVYETDDDYFSLNPNIPLEKLNRKAIPSAHELIRICDVITVSTPRLKEVVNDIVKDRKMIFTMPNSLNFDEYKQRPRKSKQLRIGWQGSNVHMGDLLMIIKPLRRLQKKHGFKLVLFGIDDQPLEDFYKFCKSRKFAKRKWSDDTIKLYEILQTMDYEHHPFTKTVDEYQKKLPELDFDIGLCPLQDNKFNQAKSCLKYYEYVMTGTAALASNVRPYNEEMYESDLAHNVEYDWEEKLDKLITNGQYRGSRLRAQEGWVRGHRNIKEIAKWWEEVYLLLLKLKNESLSNKK